MLTTLQTEDSRKVADNPMKMMILLFERNVKQFLAKKPKKDLLFFKEFDAHFV